MGIASFLHTAMVHQGLSSEVGRFRLKPVEPRVQSA